MSIKPPDKPSDSKKLEIEFPRNKFLLLTEKHPEHPIIFLYFVWSPTFHPHCPKTESPLR